MAQFTAKPLSAMPNAGQPVSVEGRNIYLCSPEYMAQYARRFLQLGVKIVGGCCGTTPEHIKEIRSEVRSLQPGVRQIAVTAREADDAGRARLEPVPTARKSQLGAKLAGRRRSSPSSRSCRRAASMRPRRSRARGCARDAGIDCINVPDGPRASARMTRAGDLPAHPAAGRHRGGAPFLLPRPQHPAIQSELLGAHAAGIRNLICITGDPPRMGTYPDATAVFDVDSIGLVNIVNNLNHGLDIGGNPMGSQTALLIGVGANPGALNLDEEHPPLRLEGPGRAPSTSSPSRSSTSTCSRRSSTRIGTIAVPSSRASGR